jgi:excisionase family DNA binding protein
MTKVTTERQVVQEYFNPTDAGRYTGFSRSTIYRAMDSGELPFCDRRGRRIARGALDDWLKPNPGEPVLVLAS